MVEPRSGYFVLLFECLLSEGVGISKFAWVPFEIKVDAICLKILCFGDYYRCNDSFVCPGERVR